MFNLCASMPEINMLNILYQEIVIVFLNVKKY